MYSNKGKGFRQSREPRTGSEDSLRTANRKATAGKYGAEAEAAILYLLWYWGCGEKRQVSDLFLSRTE